ncbi:MAG: hypothetical protein AB4038_13225 [Prochloraceae cyanobacterium]
MLETDEQGFILTGADLRQVDAHKAKRHRTSENRPQGWTLERKPYLLETNIPGIFAVGDVRHSSIKRVASAVGEGSICVQFVHRYLAEVL